MMNPQIKILDFDCYLQEWRVGLQLGKTYREAFLPPDPDSLVGSLGGLREAIRWSWLQWKKKTEFEPIRDALKFVTMRSAEALTARRLPRDSFRGLHDRMLLCCAVLSADAGTMQFAAERAMQAASSGNSKAHELALAGILKARLLSDTKTEQKQLRILGECHSLKSDPIPSGKLIRAFVDQDYDTLAKEVALGARRHWSDNYIRPAIIQENAEQITIKIGKKDCYFVWPYVEAVFAKLAMMDGATITYDDFWFPLDFVTAGIDRGPMTNPPAQTPQRESSKRSAAVPGAQSRPKRTSKNSK